MVSVEAGAYTGRGTWYQWKQGRIQVGGHGISGSRGVYTGRGIWYRSFFQQA